MHASNDTQGKSYHAPLIARLKIMVMAALMQQPAISTPNHAVMRAGGVQENDVVLCDGPCNRAYHFWCVRPLLQEADLNDDEGWLCPGCDAKVTAAHGFFLIGWTPSEGSAAYDRPGSQRDEDVCAQSGVHSARLMRMQNLAHDCTRARDVCGVRASSRSGLIPCPC